MTFRTLSISLLAGFGLLTFLSAARADIYGLSATSTSTSYGYIDPTGYITDKHTDSHSGTMSPISSMASSYAPNPYDYASGTTSAKAQYDTLHADLYLYPGRSGGLPGAQDDSQSTASWFDTVTVGSDTLQMGDPVTLLLTARYTGTITTFVNKNFISSLPATYATGTANFTSNIQPLGGSLLSLNDSKTATSRSDGDLNGQVTLDKTFQQTLTTTVGTTLLLNSQIDFVGDANSIFFKLYGQVSGSVDSTFTVTSQTPGVSLYRASDVPEPNSLALFASVMVVLGSIIRRRR